MTLHYPEWRGNIESRATRGIHSYPDSAARPILHCVQPTGRPQGTGLIQRWEQCHYPLPPTNLFVQALLHVIGTHLLPIFLRQHDHPRNVFESIFQSGADLARNSLKARDEDREPPVGLRKVVGVDDPIGARCHLGALAPRCMRQPIAHEMHLAALPGDPLELLAGGFHKTRRLPELTHLDAQDFTRTVGVNARGHEDGF